MGKSLGTLKAAVAVLGLGCLPAQASLFTFNVTEQSGNVDVSGFGSVDLTGLSFNQTVLAPASAIDPGTGALVVGGFSNSNIYTGLSGPASFGSGGTTLTSNPTDASDIVGVISQNSFLVVPGKLCFGRRAVRRFDLCQRNLCFARVNSRDLHLHVGQREYPKFSGGEHRGPFWRPRTIDLGADAAWLCGDGIRRLSEGQAAVAFRRLIRSGAD